METVLFLGGVVIVIGLVGLGSVVIKSVNGLQGQITKLRKENNELKLRMINVEGKTNVQHIELTGVDFNSKMNKINLDAIGRNLDRLLEKMDKIDKGEKYDESITVNVSPEVMSNVLDDVLKKMNL